MNFLRSASRKATFESDSSSPCVHRLWLTCRGRHQVFDEETATSTYEAWCQGAEMIQDRDGDLVKAWADQADGLVTFAALFSAVVTSFIIESYTALQPDTKMITINLLRQIAAQLNGTALPVEVLASDTPFEPALSDVLRNSTLFASLICSLLAAGMGIFYKEWLREYTRDLPEDPHKLARARQYRYEGMQTWRMQEILSGISIFLQLGVAFFILAIVLFTWPLHPVVRLVLNVFVIVWVVFWIGTAFCPLISADCPFRSPLSRAIFGVISFARRVGRKVMLWMVRGASGAAALPHTLEAQEEQEVDKKGDDLDRSALVHLYNSRWGDPWLANLDPCVEDLEAEVAREVIYELAVPRCAPTPFEHVVEGRTRVGDRGVMHLVELWTRIEKRRLGPTKEETPSPGGNPASLGITTASCKDSRVSVHIRDVVTAEEGGCKCY